MGKPVKLMTDDGPLFVEIDASEANIAGYEYTSTEGNGKTSKALETISDLAVTLKSTLERAFKEVRAGVSSLEPDEIEAELGVKLSAEAGGAWVLAKASGEANLKVKCKWQAPK